MSQPGRKLALLPGKDADLATIKQATSCKTDSAAMNEAISFRARFATADVAKMTVALATYEKLKGEVLAGAEICATKPNDPAYKHSLVVPVL